jgi:CBS domain-containing protein
MAVSLGLLLGAISSATAPAATTDVLWENKTRGPLTSTVLGLVAMDAGVALILFAIATSVAGVLSGEVTVSLGMSILHLVYEVGVAILLGSFIGLGLSRLIKGYIEEDKILVFSLGAILLIIGLTQILELDMILCAMSMGFFMSNFSPRRSKVLFKLVEKFAPPLYVLFFVLVGAKLNIWEISGLIAILALIFLVGRTFGKYLGATLGARISHAPETVRKYLPFCLLSQAGVAVGLSIVAGETFQGPLGSIIVMVVTSSTFVVQILGPPFVRYAVDHAGEIGLNITEEDLLKQSKAEDMMHPAPAIRENQSVTDVLAHFSRYDNLVYPVVDASEKLMGVITIDLLKDTFMASQLSGFLLAHDISVTVPCSCHPDTPAEDVYMLMKKHNLDYIPVLDKENHALGVVEKRIAQKLFSLKIMKLRQKAEALG